jgi:hypothetical protein
MAKWYEQAYPGGPMVKVAGFPRPLYPPDAAKQGKTPSATGPDVIAYKRTVSRAGRWPWPASGSAGFDDAFSNAFSHGKSGNVSETGIAGVQRQQKLDPTGWIGEKTFNLLRSIKIPQGLPNAGQMAMDATAVNLISQAWMLYGGKEPEPKPPEDEEATVRTMIVEFCNIGLSHTSVWDYRQYRPVPLNVNPASPPDGDCSSSVIWAFDYARRKTGVKVPDPAKQNWSGYGNTDYYEDDWPRVSGSYKVGDLAHYNGHVTMCMVAGDWNTSDWWSFGSEPPSRRKLGYRSDFRFVCRPPLC